MSQIDTLVSTLALLALCLLALYLLYFFAPSIRARRALRRLPTTELVSAPRGVLVKVAGRVRPIAEPFAAPLTGRTCVAYEVTLLRWYSGSAVPTRVRSAARVRDFLVDDGTGTALVEAEGATLALEPDWLAQNESDEHFLHQLERWGLALDKVRGWSKYQISEAIIEPDEVIAALGVLGDGSPPELGASHGQRVFVSDDRSVLDHAGHRSRARFRRRAHIALAVATVATLATALALGRRPSRATPRPVLLPTVAPLRVTIVDHLGAGAGESGRGDPMAFARVTAKASHGGTPVDVRFDVTNRTNATAECMVGIDLASRGATVGHSTSATGRLAPGQVRNARAIVWPPAAGFDEVKVGSTLCF